MGLIVMAGGWLQASNWLVLGALEGTQAGWCSMHLAGCVVKPALQLCYAAAGGDHRLCCMLLGVGAGHAVGLHAGAARVWASAHAGRPSQPATY